MRSVIRFAEPSSLYPQISLKRRQAERNAKLEHYRGAKEEGDSQGSGRSSLKEQIHFIEISYGSLMEAYNQLIIAADLKYIDEQSLESLKPDIDTVAKLLNGLRSSYSRKLPPSKP